MASKSRLIASAFTKNADVREENLDNIIDQTIEPETLNFAVDVREAGHEADWKWSWDPTSLPYQREKITLQTQAEVPLYQKGTYQLDNFSAFNTNGQSSQTHKIFLKWIEEPGDANLVSWVTYDSGLFTFEGVADSAQRAQRLNWSVPESITIPTLNTSTVNYNVGVNSGEYEYTGTAVGSNLNVGPLRRGNTYNFILDSTTNGHPFYLTTDDGSGFVAGSYVGEYTNGVTNSRSQGSAGTDATLTFVVPDSAPQTLYYQCGNHSSMRGEITIKNLAVEETGDGLPQLYFQHSQEGHFTPAPIKPVPSIQGQMCLTFDAEKGRFVPQDLRVYMEKTNTFAEKIREEIDARSANESKVLELIGTNAIDSDKMIGFMKTKNILNQQERFNNVDSDAVEDIFNNTRGTVIDSDYINEKIGITQTSQQVQTENHTTLQQDGTLSVTTGTARWYAPRDIELTRMRAHINTASVGSNVELRVNKNGSSIQTLSISAGQNNTSVISLSPPISVSEGDYLTVDVTAVGSTTAGSDLSLIIRYK